MRLSTITHVSIGTHTSDHSMYDRGLPDPHPIPRPKSRLQYRIQTLVGITGARMSRYRTGWLDAILACPAIIWRPQILGILLFEVRLNQLRTAVVLT